MSLIVTFIVVFVAQYGVVYSSPYQTYDLTSNRTKPLTNIPSLVPLDSLKYTDAELTSETFKDLMLAVQLNELRDASAQPRLNGKSRRKRSVFNLLSMLGCATNCNRLYVSWYGNYCGWGGSGIPIDDIDRCCKRHDDCYSFVERDYPLTSSIYFGSYDWKCNRGYPTCGWYQDSWRGDMCRCDVQFIVCLNKYGCPRWW